MPKKQTTPKTDPVAVRAEAYRKALAAKDYKKALKELDQMMAMRPQLVPELIDDKVTVMLRIDKQSAYGFAKKVSEEQFKGRALPLNNIAWALVSDKEKLPQSFYTLGIQIAQQAVNLGEAGGPQGASTLPYALDTLAYAYYRVGDMAKAIPLQERAVSAAQKDKAMPPAVLKEIKDRLLMFKKQKAV